MYTIVARKVFLADSSVSIPLLFFELQHMTSIFLCKPKKLAALSLYNAHLILNYYEHGDASLHRELSQCKKSHPHILKYKQNIPLIFLNPTHHQYEFDLQILEHDLLKS